MRLRHVVITSVCRDDLPDGGAEHFRQTIEAVRARNPGTQIEVLVPDFGGQADAIATVMCARPDVFNHNLETVRRLTPQVRSRASYERSLAVLDQADRLRQGLLSTKSGLMLGLGETESEVLATMADLRRVSCDILTLGQYLQPTRQNLPVASFVTPAQFAAHADTARRLGFRQVMSGPLVRSSYHAEALLAGPDVNATQAK